MASDRIVHIIDGDTDHCQRLERLLRAAGIATVVYETAHAFLDTVPTMCTGCLLVDLATPGMALSTLQNRLKRLGTCLPIIATAAKGDVTTAVQAMKAGAVDIIEDPVDDQHLVAAIKAALLEPRDELGPGEAVEAAQRLSILSSRERQVLGEIVAGQQNKVIAHNLAISMRTVEVHRAHILKRLGLRSMAEAISLAVLAKLTDFEEDGERAS